MSPKEGRTASDRRPRDPWGRVWCAGLLITLVTLGGWELVWRSRGWVATASDPAAFTLARERADQARTVVIGASRAQADLDPRAWAAATGEPEPPMLALFGSTSVPTLEHLAASDEFGGLVLVDWLPGHALDPEASTLQIDALIEAYELTRTSPGRWLETRMTGAVDPRLVLRRPVLSLRSLVEIGWNRAWPRARFLWPPRGMRPNRFYPMTFAEREAPAANTGALAHSGSSVEPLRWNAGTERMFARVETAVRVIRSRGGEVVFVRFPSCGARLAWEEAVFPRSEFWDRFAARTSSPTIHFADYPTLARFDCPEGSHLDVRDTDEFTRALAAVFESVGASGELCLPPSDRGCSPSPVPPPPNCSPCAPATAATTRPSMSSADPP